MAGTAADANRASHVRRWPLSYLRHALRLMGQGLLRHWFVLLPARCPCRAPVIRNSMPERLQGRSTSCRATVPTIHHNPIDTSHISLSSALQAHTQLHLSDAEGHRRLGYLCSYVPSLLPGVLPSGGPGASSLPRTSARPQIVGGHVRAAGTGEIDQGVGRSVKSDDRPCLSCPPMQQTKRGVTGP